MTGAEAGSVDADSCLVGPEEAAYPIAAGRSGNDDKVISIVGSTPATERLRQMITLASRSNANVLIVGETGTGKELVARAIHRMSGSSLKPFVPHNCATTPADMFDTEFFGHERGSFTHAFRARRGLLREADRGVLLLDELECLSLVNQAKLLRVLDDGQFRPIGSDQTISVSVRFIAATNRPPETMLATGELREDLYYRLREFEIRLSPLRERNEDIACLAEHFLQGTGKHITPACLEILRRCSWPGNIRQLRTELRCAAARTVDCAIEAESLDSAVFRATAGDVRALSTPGRSLALSLHPNEPPLGRRSLQVGKNILRGPLSVEGTLRALQREAIRLALDAESGNFSRAAKSLGIHRSTLYRKLRELRMLGDNSNEKM